MGKFNKKALFRNLSIALFFIVVLSLMLMLPNVISSDSAENTKTYDATKKEITFKDNTLAKIAIARLDTPQTNYVIAGGDRVKTQVAQISINAFEDYDDALKQIEFINIKTGKTITRQVEYKYLSEYEVEVPKYKQVCSEGKNINSSTGKVDLVCTQEQDGTKKETRSRWLLFDKNIRAGNTTIGIYTNVYPDDYVEWYPEMFGLKVSEWARWTAVNSYANYTFDNPANYTEDTGTNKIPINLTKGVFTAGSDCKVNGCGQTVGTMAGTYASTAVKQGSFGFWINGSDYGTRQFVMNYNAGNWSQVNFGDDPSWDGKLRVVTSAIDIASGYLANNTWIHIVVKFNATGGSIWINGTMVASQNSNSVSWYGTSDVRGMFSEHYGTNGIVGNTTFDEMKFFDQATVGELTAAQILDWYNTEFPIANTPPTHDNPILKTPSGKNFSYENLTCYNQSTYDADGDSVTNIYNWYKNSQPLAVLNLPFENSTRDYSGYGNNGTKIGNPQLITGKVGKAFQFDGIDDYVDSGNDASLQMATKFTIEAWINWQGTANKNYYAISKGKIGWTIPYNGYQIRYNKYSDSEGYWIFDIADSNTQDSISWRQDPSTANNIWYHIIVTFDNGEMKLYSNGVLKTSKTSAVTNVNVTNQNLRIGMYSYSASPSYAFNGTIDEVKIYPYALSAEQIKQRYGETKDGFSDKATIVSQETSGGDVYMCKVTPNDGEDDGTTNSSNNLSVLWAITFNVTYGETGGQETNFNINCNNSFSISGVSSPYKAGFLPRDYECTFTKLERYNKTITFTANNDKIINVTLSREFSLTIEEHTWLEAIYDCIVLGDCSLYNLLLEINQTVGNIWEQTKSTDESVVIFENITNKIVDSTHNLTIDYSVYIPIKAGYGIGDYLPIRIGYWFLDENNQTCYNQGDKPTGVSEPYCQPLIIETIGPMGGQINFTVELQPSLLAGNYSIKRIIDIDPNNVWINYGQEVLSPFVMAESLSTYGGSSKTINEIMPEKEGLLENIKSKITGAVTGVSQLLSGGQITFIITILCITFIIFIILRYRTQIMLKKKF